MTIMFVISTLNNEKKKRNHRAYWDAARRNRCHPKSHDMLGLIENKTNKQANI